MLKYLLLENFVKHKHTEITFEKGMTAIVGKNGGGKSLIQEAIRFALFGTAALRGKLENYDKNLRVLLKLSIAGVEYEIDRTLKDCKFNGVVGTTWCNKAIEDKLGFGLNVFDMGCCAKQFEITKLGDMKPTERKQAVDKLIGLDALELLRKEIKQTVSELRGRKEGLEKYCVVPVEPEGKGVFPSDEIKKLLDQGRSIHHKLEDLMKVITSAPSEEPKLTISEPEKPKGSIQLASKIKYLTSKIYQLGNFNELDEETKAEIEACKAWEPFKDFKEPELTWEQILEAEKSWEAYDLWTNATKAQCPKCGHEFTLGDVIEKTDKPAISKTDIEVARIAWAHKEVLPKIEKPKRWWDKETIEEVLKTDEKAKERKKLEAELKECDECASLEEWEAYDKAIVNYMSAKNAHNIQHSAWESAQLAKAELPLVIAEANKFNIEKLEEDYRNAITWEAEYNNYLIAKQHYEDVQSELNVICKDLESYKLAEEGITNLKSKIKGYVIPSLQKEASRLVSEMTEGEMNQVEITDDFEITVNGKELALLSGSEKAVANLAIRLGLGCVLTRKVFNVFMGDEIDESMSEERAERVAESLHRLLGTIDQIILISHKDITADCYFSVDNL